MDKPTLILALAFFMISAPNPDADAVAEMTANFIVPKNEFVLNADELVARPEDAQELVLDAQSAVPADSETPLP